LHWGTKVTTIHSQAWILQQWAVASLPAAGAMTGDAAPVFCDFDGNPRAIGQITDVGARLYGTLAAVAQSGKVRPVSGHTVHPRYTMSTNQIYDLRGRVVNVINAGGKSRAAVVTLRKDGTGMVRGVKVAPCAPCEKRRIYSAAIARPYSLLEIDFYY
jgi:hypothetical protein